MLKEAEAGAKTADLARPHGVSEATIYNGKAKYGGLEVLGIDADCALRCAQLHVPDPRPGRDAWIAAIALENGLAVVTRNDKDFEPMDVATINPFSGET